ncbi:WD repeat-containing protein 43 [Araneus ventricosus]|uniref:WD repeat-containing protein 43 n=1 Tax=Araneus ventricosus TaxID=182803 RepID=A0A4Y2I7D1_ARAVE|nr:WD repeat-containing protein 43 [Araneus ventricosus]
MSLYRNIIAFSYHGEYLAYSSPDGCLKIWETSTGTLKQEFTPSSHLTATCTTLTWGPSQINSNLPKSPKKSRNESLSVVGNLQLIAMGTLTGDILLYSFTNAELYSLLQNGHTGAVNDIYWHHVTNSLFTCSNDQHIIQWDISSGKIKSKWKADKFAVYSICVIDENRLLSAGNSVQLWDIKQKSVIKSFEGHSTEIHRLLLLPTRGKSLNEYFLSAALGDRVINAWQLNENKAKGTIATFVSTSEPGNIDIALKKKGPFRMSVVTKDGQFHLFEHILNGTMKKPLSPKFTIQIASKTDNASSKPYLIPILAANISEGLDSCLITYGSFIKPMFERINISDISKDLILIRDLSFSSTISIEDSVSRIKHAEKPNNVKMLAPGHMTDVTLTESTSKKRKQKNVDIRELPMEERLKALDLSTTPKNLTEEPAIKSDSMVHLLLQGLQSKDNNMLNTVLQCGDKVVIQNTLKRLPLQSILLVLKELYERLNKQEPRNHPCLRWLIGLLTTHLPYLMSCKDIDEYLGPISQLIEARIENFSKMRQLQGGLKVLLSQIDSSTSDSIDPSAQPLVEYESESSEESDVDISGNNSDGEVVQSTPDEESQSSDSESDMET